MTMKKYPRQYLHVRNNRTGEEWIRPFRADAALDITKLVKAWVKREFNGELRLDGEMGPPSIDGEYYARIMTDGRSPESCVCWTSGGFYLAPTY